MIIPSQKKKIEDFDYIFPRKVASGLKIFTKKGKKVKQDTVLASGEIYEERKRYDIASKLGVRAEDAEKYIRCIHGEEIGRGDIIAQKKKRLLQSEGIVKATKGGVVDLSELKNGIVKMLGTTKEKTIHAGMDGNVVSILRNKMVRIKTHALKIKPSEIIGQTVQGELLYIQDENTKLGKNLHGSIIVIDCKIGKEYIRKLVLNGVRGVVMGGMHSTILKSREEIGLGGITVCILHGYGTIGIEKSLVKHLKQNDGYVCMLDAKHEELILPYIHRKRSKKNKHDLKQLVISIKKGQRVVIYTYELWGQYGIVKEVNGDFATVEMEEPFTNRKVEVHIHNLVGLQ